MPVYDTVEQAIKAIRDPPTLAEVASVILQKEHFPALVISGTTGDRGRDAVVRHGVWGEEFVLIQYSIAERWPRKVDSELARYGKDTTLPKRMLYVTNRVTSPAAVERKKANAKRSHRVDLEVLDYGWLWVRLEREFRDLAEELLNVRPRLPDRFVDAGTRREELGKRIPGFGAPLVETESHRQLQDAIAPPAPEETKPRVVLLVGAGGLGKTRAALESVPAGMPSVVLQAQQRFDRDAVGSLDPFVPGVLVVDDAHRARDLSGVRLLLDDRSWRGWLMIMTLRTGHTGDVLDRAGIGRDEVVEIAFDILNRPQAAELLAGQPYRITAPDLANHLMLLAKGSPLMLHLGAEAAVERRLSAQGQAELLRLYASRLLRPLPNPVHRDLVTIAALLGRLDLSMHLPLIRALHPAAALPDLRSHLADLSDAGLGLFLEDVFTVVPESIAPVIVLDELLRVSGSPRLRLAELRLRELDEGERAAVLPTFAAAVAYGEGQGADALRQFAVSVPSAETSSGQLGTILREARLYAPALPDDARLVLERSISLHRAALESSPHLLATAAGAARELSDISLARGLPLLLSLVAIEPPAARDDMEGPRATLSHRLERAPTSFVSAAPTDRAVAALQAVRSWLAEDASSPARQRVAIRAALMLVAVAYEWVGPSAADAMAIHLGGVRAPETAEHRAAVMGSAKFVAELISNSDGTALDELRSAYPALIHRGTGLYPPAMGPLPEWHRRTLRSATTIVRSAILSAWDRLPIGVRLRCLEVDSNLRLAARALSDPEVERFSILFAISPAGRLRSHEWSRQLQRAEEMGRALGPHQAIDVAMAALDVADAQLRPDAIGNLIGGAGAGTTRQRAGAAVARVRGEPRLQLYLGSLLAGIARGPGLPTRTLLELASDQQAAVHIPRILDLVEPRIEARLIDKLFGQPSCHGWLADHFRTSPRYDPRTRAERLLALAEATDEEHLPTVLEQFGGVDTSVSIPEDLRPRLLAQMLRAAGTADLDRRSGGNIGDAYHLVVRWGDDAWLDVIAARRDAMLDAQPGDRRLWDLISDHFTPGLHALSTAQRDRAIPRIAAWLEEPTTPPLGWRVELGLQDLIVRVGAGRPDLPRVIAEWYQGDAEARGRALRLLGPLAGREALPPVLAEILMSSDRAGDDPELMVALATPPMSWIGDLEKEYRARAERLRDAFGRGGRRLRAFAETAAAELERLADEEQARARARHEGYEL